MNMPIPGRWKIQRYLPISPNTIQRLLSSFNKPDVWSQILSNPLLRIADKPHLQGQTPLAVESVRLQPCGIGRADQDRADRRRLFLPLSLASPSPPDRLNVPSTSLPLQNDFKEDITEDASWLRGERSGQIRRRRESRVPGRQRVASYFRHRLSSPPERLCRSRSRDSALSPASTSF